MQKGCRIVVDNRKTLTFRRRKILTRLLIRKTPRKSLHKLKLRHLGLQPHVRRGVKFLPQRKLR